MLAESIEKFCQLGIGKELLNWTPKAQNIKEKIINPTFKKWGMSIIKRPQYMSEKATKIITMQTYKKGTIPRLYKEFLSNRIQREPVDKKGKRLEQTMHKKRYTNTNNHMKGYSGSLLPSK